MPSNSPSVTKMRSASGALIADVRLDERRALVAAPLELSDDIAVVPMQELAWRMRVLVGEQPGLSARGSEVVAAAEALGAGVLTSSRDDSPGIRGSCGRMRIRSRTLSRLARQVS
jgi:hypothetical protein